MLVHILSCRSSSFILVARPDLMFPFLWPNGGCCTWCPFRAGVDHGVDHGCVYAHSWLTHVVPCGLMGNPPRQPSRRRRDTWPAFSDAHLLDIWPLVPRRHATRPARRDHWRYAGHRGVSSTPPDRKFQAHPSDVCTLLGFLGLLRRHRDGSPAPRNHGEHGDSSTDPLWPFLSLLPSPRTAQPCFPDSTTRPYVTHLACVSRH